MSKGNFWMRTLILFSTLITMTGLAWAVTESDVVRLKAKAANGEQFTMAERYLAHEAERDLGSKFTWPSNNTAPRRPANRLDEYAWASVPYEWVDISAIGTEAGIANDDESVGPFDIGFDFPFYGNNFTQIYMTSNGWATFEDQGGWATYVNVPIPDGVTPNNTMYAFWDDLFPPNGGQYYYYSDEENERFVMSWIDVPHIGTTDEIYTFQIILTPDGNVRYNYENVTEGGIYGNLSCGSGIEDGTSAEGLQICNEGEGTLPASGTSILVGEFDGIPNPVTNLASTVNEHDVTLTWTDPTEDTNGNPLTLTNIEVWNGLPGSGDLVATVAPGAQSALIANMTDGSHTITVRPFATPFYGGDVRMTVIVGNPSYFSDFDDDEGLWTGDPGWTWGPTDNQFGPEPYSVPNTWSTDSEVGYPDTANYLLNLDLGLTVDSEDAYMEFYCWYDAEWFWDGCNLKASIDGGDTWSIVEPDGGYPTVLNAGTFNPIQGEPAWSGQSGSWLYTRVPLGQFVGEAPILRFQFGADEIFAGYPGFYFDDMIIWGLSEPVLSTISGTVSFDGGNGIMTAVNVRADGLGAPSVNPEANGAYTLNGVLVGNRRVRANLAGYHEALQVVNVPEGGATGVNLTLVRLDPPAPTNLTGSVNSSTGVVTLNWDDSVDPLVDIYRVYRKLSDDDVYAMVGTSNVSGYTETLTADGIYQYRVTAVDNNVSTPVESDSTDRINILYGEIPVSLVGTNGDYDDRIRVSWAAPGPLEGVEVAYDDGTAEDFYVVSFPAGPMDYFCVRMTPPDEALYPLLLYSVAVFVEDQITIPWIGLCPPSPTGSGADVDNPLFEWTDLQADGTPGWVTLTTDLSVFLTEPSDFYIAYKFPEGQDDQPAVGSDLNQVDERSYWTQDPSQFWNQWFAHDWIMRAWVGGPPPEGMLSSARNDLYMLSTGTPTGYAIERVPTVAVTNQPAQANLVTERDPKLAAARGPVRTAHSSYNPLDQWFRPYVTAPELTLESRDPRTPLDDIVNYKVYRNGTMIAQPVETFYMDLNRVENTSYNYYVTAMYDNGIESAPSPTRAGMCNMAPASPVNLIGTPIGSTQMHLTWNAPTTNADGTPLVDLQNYKVYRNGVVIATLAPGVTSYNDTPPQNDGFYSWTVTAEDEVPNVSNPAAPFVGAVVSPFEAIDYEWVDITGVGTLAEFAWWGATAGPFELGFNYPFLGDEYTQIWISPGGWVTLQETFGGLFFNQDIPDNNQPHAAIYPFWDETTVDLQGGAIYYYQDSANDRFIISWIDVPHLFDLSFLYTFQLIIEEGGAAIFNYHTIPSDGWPGNQDCTIGVEDATSTSAIQVYSFGVGSIPPLTETSIAFWAGPSGTITGLVREFGSNAPIANAELTVDQVPDLVAMTDAQGLYVLEVEPGTYTVNIHIQGYCDQTLQNVVVVDEGTSTQNFSMRQPSFDASVTSLNVLSVTGQNATAHFDISNPGATCALDFTITTNHTWLTVDSPSGTVEANQTRTINVTGATAGFTPGDYSATILINHNDHNSPYTIPVTVSVTLDAPDPAELPTEFALHQNYPNPFNATTTLNFDVPQESRVSLVLYNVAGQEVARPVDQLMTAGRHHVSYDATNLPTGMYLVKMTAGSYSAVQKMILLK